MINVYKYELKNEKKKSIKLKKNCFSYLLTFCYVLVVVKGKVVFSMLFCCIQKITDAKFIYIIYKCNRVHEIQNTFIYKVFCLFYKKIFQSLY